MAAYSPLRGHASIQGSTDIPTLFDLLPGYLPMPLFKEDSDDLRGYIEKRGAKTGWWANFDKYIVSLLKAYYGDAATAENDYGFRWLPRLTGDHSHMAYWLEMSDGKMEGLFVMGDNPAVAGPNSGFERRALAKLKWLVVRDLVEIETASFWYDSPEVKRGETQAGRYSNGSVPDAGCWTRRKGRYLHEYAAPAPVSRKSGGSAGRLA